MILEGHNITENNSDFFKNNSTGDVLLLTPMRLSNDNQEKLRILRELNIQPVYELSLEDCVKLGIVAPYNVHIIQVPLDDKEAYCKAGNKTKVWYQTEKAKYKYLTNSVNHGKYALARIERMHFIANTMSKAKAAQWVLNNVISSETKTLIFCGSKKQADILCEHRFYSKPTKPKKLTPRQETDERKVEKYKSEMRNYERQKADWQGDESLKAFVEDRIKWLCCVEALNEGMNLDTRSSVDLAFMVQLNSKELHFRNRMGRILRYAPDFVGNVIVLALEDTEDLTWANRATITLDQNRVFRYKLQDLKDGKETLKF